jgi:5'-AMP-activated protein kinase regulatory gamma subunit
MFSELGISAVPIVDSQGKVINLYETVDVIVRIVIIAEEHYWLTMCPRDRPWSGWEHITTWT